LPEVSRYLMGLGLEARASARRSGLEREPLLDRDQARAARTQLENGFGDVLTTYEQELIADRARAVRERLPDLVVTPPRATRAPSRP
jgi:ABC-type sulfate transport system substrate-binding protein